MIHGRRRKLVHCTTAGAIACRPSLSPEFNYVSPICLAKIPRAHWIR